jgi:two-component system nitrate/nitrite response regulator NarL
MTGMPALAGQPAEEPGPRLAAGPSNQAADQSLAERRIRAIVVDDNTTIRQAVRDALQESGVVVIAQASDGREGVELAWHYKPDVVVLDVFMPGLDGISAMQRIHERLPDACCIMLSVSADRELGIMALRAGAAGFLTKGAISPTRLADIIRGALDGEVAASPRLVADIVAELRRMPQGGIGMRPVRSVLTPREWEVLDLMSLGYSTRQIADELVLSTETIRTHVKNLMRKLGAKSRREAIERGARERQTGEPGGPPTSLPGRH